MKRWTPIVAIALAALALLLLLLGPVGTRLGFWDFRFGFTLLRWGAYAGVATAVAGIVAGLVTHRWLLAAFVFAAGGIAAAIPWSWAQHARAVPPIHDITTDTENPPPFVAIAPLRADAPNPVEYPGPETAALQRQAYPDLKPLRLDVPPDVAFERVRRAARSLGWEIVAAEPSEGRLEAIDKTFWFGFIDDVVVRVTPSDGGSIVDVRSKSRVGRGDVGTNARRIRHFLSIVDH